MNTEKPILILYTSGAYGTFLDWCLHWFSGRIDKSVLPFRNTGSAHEWIGCPTGDVSSKEEQTLDWWLSQPNMPLIIRSHSLWEMHNDSVEEFLSSYGSKFKRIINITNNPDWYLLILHNSITKTKPMNRDILFKQIINQFSKQFRLNENNIPKWQMREIISYWHEQHHYHIKEFYQPINHQLVINVNLRNFINNFETSLINLFDDLNFEMTRKECLEEIKNKWLSIQKYIDIDIKCQEIINATINNQNIITDGCEFDIINEAFILYKLRCEYGLDFLCAEQNDFPKNTTALKRLLIPHFT